MEWGWYLQVDFQLYVLSTILLYLYSKNKILLYSITSLLGIGSTALELYYTYIYEIKISNYRIGSPNMQKYLIEFSRQPFGRFVPYFSGLIVGILFM